MIQATDLKFTYRQANRPALEGLSFEVQEGEILGFLGPSGAGKSTTQKILIGLLKEYEGKVVVLGKDLHSWNYSLYEQIGVSFEYPNHYLKLTALENLRYFASLYDGATQDSQALLDLVGLSADGRIPVSQYSKGMKIRLSVARSLLNDPQLLFLDEPTAGLDPVNARRIRKLVKEQKQNGKTIFLTTHDMMVADDLCDRVAFIVDGRIVLVDSPRSLKIQYGHPKVDVVFRTDSGTERMEFPLKKLADNNEFLDILRTREVQTIHSQEATLEDVFIQVTGRALS